MIDHSSTLHQDFSQFLYNEQLSDLQIIVRKGLKAFDINLDPIEDVGSIPK